MPSATSRLDGGVIPAVPVPFRSDGALDHDAQVQYARWMAGQQPAGVAVWAHTGRGLHLSDEDRHSVLECWRSALPDRVIVAGVGAAPGAPLIPDAVACATQARGGGADMLLVHPPTNRGADAVGYHAALGEIGLPLLAFYLYEAAGGVAYPDEVLHEILALPQVIGVKVATLDSVMTFQHIAQLIAQYPDKVLVTGEDRFLGYSIMMGARAALIGMGAALTDLQVALFEAQRTAEGDRFFRLSRLCDRFAQVTFVPPMEGYVQRMLWAAAAQGALPEQACHDPWGPELPLEQKPLVQQAVRTIEREWRG